MGTLSTWDRWSYPPPSATRYVDLDYPCRLCLPYGSSEYRIHVSLDSIPCFAAALSRTTELSVTELVKTLILWVYLFGLLLFRQPIFTFPFRQCFKHFEALAKSMIHKSMNDCCVWLKVNWWSKSLLGVERRSKESKRKSWMMGDCKWGMCETLNEVFLPRSHLLVLIS